MIDRRIIREEIGMVNEAMKDTFSYATLSSLRSYSQRVKYCREQLGGSIGSGSSRVVFQIDDEKCLKLAKNEKGVAQNQAEYDWNAQNYGVMLKLYDCDDDYTWIVVEYVLPAKMEDFRRCLGIDWETFCSFVIAVYAEYCQKKMPVLMGREEMYALCRRCKWLDNMRLYMSDYQPPYGDLIAIRNYGMALRGGQPEIVILDSGLNESVWRQYYR